MRNATKPRYTARRKGRRRGRQHEAHVGRWAAGVIVLLLLVYMAVLANSRPHVGGDRLRYDRFLGLISAQQVKDAKVLDQDEIIVGHYVRDDGVRARYQAPYTTVSGHTSPIDVLLQNGVPTTIDHQYSKRLLAPASALLPALIVVVVFIYLILSYSRGTGLFAVRSGARRSGSDDVAVTFADIAGHQAAVDELREICAFLHDPGRFAAVGATVPRGVLLYGPPGCGKTLLARAIAGEARASFFSISGADFVELYVGVGAARVRDLFAEARECTPAIVFIDELDAIGRRRGSSPAAGLGSVEEQEQTLNQILTELDGFSPLSGIIVVAATNRPDILDPALLRPGRFDRTIGLERPDEVGREAILTLHARGKTLDSGVDLPALARRAVGLSGADLANVMNEGALLAARDRRASIAEADLAAALDRVMEAPERQRRLSMRSRASNRSTGAVNRVSFADVAGADEAMAELGELCDYLSDPERFAALGARPASGVLLVGPPGCGKTLLARALATETNAVFFSVAGPEFVEVFSGEGAARVRDLFAEARAAAPSIVFIDEIDAIGGKRTASAGEHRERESTLNQILVELDGFESRTGVLVVAATNRSELLDDALVRPGRFDRRVAIELPDRYARKAILAVHARDKTLAADVELGVVAAMTQGFSGADLANVLNEAALLAARQHLNEVSMTLIEEGIGRALMGVARTRVLTAEERAVMAVHEVGHALVGREVLGAHRIRRMALAAHAHSAGLAHADGLERAVHSRSSLMGLMAGLLGGRAAESIVFGEPGSAGADDLANVEDLAFRMVCQLGMSADLPPRSYGSVAGATPLRSDLDPRVVNQQIDQLVREAYEQALAVVTTQSDLLDRASRALLTQEKLTAAELDELAAVRPVRTQLSAGK